MFIPDADDLRNEDPYQLSGLSRDRLNQKLAAELCEETPDIGLIRELVQDYRARVTKMDDMIHHNFVMAIVTGSEMATYAAPAINLDYVPDATSLAPLLVATLHGAEDLVDLFLTELADPDVISSSDRKTPLIAAAMKGEIAIAGMLFDAGANPFLRDIHGRRAKDYALDRKAPEMVKLIEDAESRITDLQSKKTLSPKGQLIRPGIIRL